MNPSRWIRAAAGQLRDLPVAVAGLVYGVGLFALVALTMLAVSGPSVRPLDVLATLLICLLGGTASVVLLRRRNASGSL